MADEGLHPPDFKLLLNVSFKTKNIFFFLQKGTFKEASDPQTLNIAKIGPDYHPCFMRIIQLPKTLQPSG